MLVNSIVFLAFFSAVLIPYFSLLRKNTKLQNMWILVASYFFYGYADWTMIPLLLGATVCFYFLGIAIRSEVDGGREDARLKKARMLMILSVILGTGMLLYFKYMNFFIEQFSALFNMMGLNTNWSSFNIIVPIGISFFTFKLISYVIEVYRGNIEAERNFVDFAAYVAFFPTILSGPIDKPNMFLPQLKGARTWNDAMVLEGCKRILWGNVPENVHCRQSFSLYRFGFCPLLSS